MTYEPEHMERWTRPDSWFSFSSEPNWRYSNACFVFLGQNRDSDSLTRSNFQCALRELGGESETVSIVRESHWACGWIEWIAIHESDEKALRCADEIVAALSDYPILDESHFSELEYGEACEYWESCSIRHRAELCKESGISIFAARLDELPSDDSGTLMELLRG